MTVNQDDRPDKERPDREPAAEPIEHAPDVVSDPARSDQVGQDWTGEGGATPYGAATSSA